MRGDEKRQESMFHMFSVESRVPQDHPLRRIRLLCNEALKSLSATFEAMYSDVGRPSVPPEMLLKSTLLMALYSIRSEKQFCEQLNFNILFRWFLGMDMSAPCFERSVFTKNRQRLLEHAVAKEFLAAVVSLAQKKNLLSADHFTVDGTLIESWASLKSFKPKERDPDDTDSNGFTPRNPDVDFHGQKRSNTTHESTTDGEARLVRKGLGKEAKLSFLGNVLSENRNGFVISASVVKATGVGECNAALGLLDDALEQEFSPSTLGADKGYHTTDFVTQLRERSIRPHIAQQKNRNIPGLDARTTRHASYAVSQVKRKLVEQTFGYAKTVAGLRKSRLIGVAATEFLLHISCAVLNLLRIAKLCPG